jgi:manganese transport protein
MKNILGLTLGIMTSLGGFVDIGQLVFTMQAGALFGYGLIWVVVLGTIGIILYMEMCGRIAAVQHRPVFHLIRERMGKRWGWVALIGANAVNIITCAAEIGAMAIVLRLLTGWSYGWLLVGAVSLLLVTVWFVRFKWLERTFGLAGLFMLVYLFSSVHSGPDWHAAAAGLLPQLPQGDGKHLLLYCYFAVGIFSAVLMPYEVYFYSSGGIEEDWTAKQIPENRLVASVSSSLGGLLTISIVVLGAVFFLPQGIFPDLLSTAAMAAALPYGRTALLLSLLGILAAVSGAAIETALSTAYNVCQFLDWKWGKAFPARNVPRFTKLWVGTFLVAFAIVITHINPMTLVQASVIFAVLILPATYLPVLLVANDKKEMGKHANGRAMRIFGWMFFVLLSLAALAGVPLLVLTHGGQP